ncbi:hypothetical protein [Sphingomonas hengshuiensis]|uniref:Uncharacterized protein n=1 Tax=Sphingomonas hengshuiensis TaxID=1609977 RepID=A0A7U4JA28_9SPHN|nr:hypothetical protein [Sphingomonas hengshuiensis]AJP73031.1 hypothetical protein TS85_16355 [Sphingomonas hengshuiensis]
MTDYRLPGGGRAWFVSTRTATSYRLNPCSPAGWWSLIGYCLFVSVAPTAILLAGGDSPSGTRWVAFGATIVLPSIAFIVTAFRMSVPARR